MVFTGSLCSTVVRVLKVKQETALFSHLKFQGSFKVLGDFETEQHLPEMEELYLPHTSEQMAKYKQVILFCSDNVHKHVMRVD